MDLLALAPQIVHGTESDATQNAVVLVMHYDALAKGGGAASGCTGALLAPNLVLTARHCVSITDDGWQCDSSGKPVSGGVISGDHTPTSLFVFTGTSRPNFLDGSAKPHRAIEVLTNGSTNTCNNDIALLVLEKPVENPVIAPVRLSGPLPNELLTGVGWGVSDLDPNPPTRLQRTGMLVKRIGPGTALGPAEFETDEGTCQGDSGGPAFANTGAIVGIVSGGRHGQGESGAAACIDSINIYTSLAGHQALITNAYERAGQDPWLENEPSPLGKPRTEAGEEEGCTQSGTGRHSGFGSYILAVLFACLRRKKR